MRTVHPFPQPVGGQFRLPEMILEIVKIIPQENGVVEFLSLKPVLRAFELMMDVGNNKGPHSTLMEPLIRANATPLFDAGEINRPGINIYQRKHLTGGELSLGCNV